MMEFDINFYLFLDDWNRVKFNYTNFKRKFVSFSHSIYIIRLSQIKTYIIDKDVSFRWK